MGYEKNKREAEWVSCGRQGTAGTVTPICEAPVYYFSSRAAICGKRWTDSKGYKLPLCSRLSVDLIREWYEWLFDLPICLAQMDSNLAQATEQYQCSGPQRLIPRAEDGTRELYLQIERRFLDRCIFLKVRRILECTVCKVHGYQACFLEP